VEVTFHEVRTHLGVETQRQWSARAIARTTPTLLGLFSLVTMAAHAQMSRTDSFVRQAAWYSKQEPTFIDALALVRRHLWAPTLLQTSRPVLDPTKIPRTLVEYLSELLCYAA
jgi:hypothetical protein